MLKSLFFLLLASVVLPNGQSDLVRIPVHIEGKIGYINGRGELAIPALFHAGDIFTEGLAPVRESGLYGYIDYHGDYVLPPAYEYAEPFRNGLARVWSEGKQSIIDREGCALFVNGHAEVFPFNHHLYTTVKSKGGKYGLMDRTGKLLFDTILGNMPEFDVAGLATAGLYGFDARHKGYYTGIIDTTGSIILPFQWNRGLKAIGNGYYELIYPGNWEKDGADPSAVIGPDGQLLVKFNGFEWAPDEEHRVSQNGVIPNKIHDVDWATLRSWSSGDRLDHAALFSASGKVIRDDPDWEFISSFTKGRAFVYDINHRYWLINEAGQRLMGISFLAVCGLDEWGTERNNIFEDGKAVVRRGRHWYLLDWDLQLTPLPDFGAGVKVTRSGDLLKLEAKSNDEAADAHGRVYGWFDLESCQLITPRYSEVISVAPGTDILVSRLKDRTVYMNRTGKVIWQEALPGKRGERNLDYLEMADFKAFAQRKGEENRNFSQYPEFNPLYRIPWSGSIGFEADLKVSTTVKGDRCFIDVINLNADTLWFPAQDGTIEMIIQAHDEHGVWHDIQYLGQSWCGHSYRTLGLPSKHAWTFSLPVYEGALRTEIRPKLTYKSAFNGLSRLTVYGNAVSGAVNPGQFWRKQDWY